MYFTSGQDRAFERLMQEKPGFDHYDCGGANAPENCGSCRFYRPDWKYQYCVYVSQDRPAQDGGQHPGRPAGHGRGHGGAGPPDRR